MSKENHNVIEVGELTKRFGDITAVDRISFGVAEGEIFGFLGPNGAGKTTAVRMLTGLLTPDSGSIFVNGVDLRKNLISTKMKMAVIPEMGNIYADLTAKQNIVLAGRFYGISKRELEKRADGLLDQFGLYDRKDDFVRTFSKGMKQRVNIASALVHQPEILFLDEPTAGLDVQSQRQIREIIRQMNQKGTSVFLTTHNIEEANLLCERVGIINKGKIVVIDRPERLRRTFEESQSVEISFETQVDSDWMEKVDPTNRIERYGNKWKLYTDKPDMLVKHLVGLAQEQDWSIVSLEICRASLEDIFVKLTKSEK